MSEQRLPPPTRRGFFAAAGGALAAAGLAHAAPGDAPRDKPDAEPNPAVGKPVSATAEAQGGFPKVPGPAPKRLGFAVVGLGKLALGEVLPAFSLTARCRPAALVSGDHDKARAVADHYGIEPKSLYSYKDFDGLRDNPAVDVVYVILPNARHEEFTIRAAQAGKHVLCEKPMAPTVEACQAMIAACDKAKRKLMIAYRCHYEPFNQKMIEMSRQQAYGPIQFIVSDTLMEVGGAKQWRLDPKLAGGGSLVDIGVYSLNAARYLTGEEPAEINAMSYSNAKDPRFKDLEQSIAFQLRFPSGVLANCTSSYSTGGGANRYRVMAAEGWYGLDPAIAYRGLRMQRSKGGMVEHVELREANHFASEMDHFAECIAEDRRPNTPGEEGMQDVKLIQLIYEAARTGKTIKV
jgi:predicted dehydrogenase